MKGSKLTRRLSVILVLGLILSMVSACGGNSAADESNRESVAKTETVESVGQSAAADSNTPITFDVFINHSWFWTDKFEGIIPQEITKRTGVTLNPTRTADDKQLGIMIASGDLPDLVYTDTQLDRLSDPQFSHPWNELIEKYDPAFKPDPVQIVIAKSYSRDDNFYTILNAFSSEEDWRNAKAGCPSTESLLYRDDILQKLGNPPMTTIEEYMKVLAMVKEKYPDITPLILDETYMLKVFKSWIIPGWTYNDFTKTEDGRIIYYTSSPKYMDFVKFANDCYRKGYMTADNFAFKDRSQSIQLATAGKAFSYSFYTGNTSDQFTQLTRAGGIPDATWFQCKPLGGASVKYYNAGIGWSGVFITQNCKDPGRAIKFMDWMYSDEGQKLTQWGREGSEWTMGDDGIPVFSQEWIDARNDDNVFYSKYTPAYYFGISGVTEAVGRASGVSKNAREVMDEIRNRLVLVPEVNLSVPKNDTDEKIIMDKIVDLGKNDEVKLILSKTDDEFNKNYDELMKKLDALGVKKLEEFMTKEAARYKIK